MRDYALYSPSEQNITVNVTSPMRTCCARETAIKRKSTDVTAATSFSARETLTAASSALYGGNTCRIACTASSDVRRALWHIG